MRGTVRAIVGIMLAAAWTAAPFAAQSDSRGATPAAVGGTWTMTLDTPHGAVPVTFDLKQEGKSVTGTFKAQMLGSLPLKGQVDGSTLTFTVSNDAGDLIYKATVKDADTLQGVLSTQMGDMAGVATRVKPKTACPRREARYDRRWR